MGTKTTWRDWQKFLILAALWAMFILALSGCCTYNGKLISRREAERIAAYQRALGQPVTVECVGEKK